MESKGEKKVRGDIATRFSSTYQPKNRRPRGKSAKSLLKKFAQQQIPDELIEGSAWLKQQLTETEDKTVQGAIMSTMLFKALQGDRHMIKMFLQLTGELTKKIEVTHTGPIDKPIGEWTNEDTREAMKMLGAKPEDIDKMIEPEDIDYEEIISEMEQEDKKNGEL